MHCKVACDIRSGDGLPTVRHGAQDGQDRVVALVKDEWVEDNVSKHDPDCIADRVTHEPCRHRRTCDCLRWLGHWTAVAVGLKIVETMVVEDKEEQCVEGEKYPSVGCKIPTRVLETLKSLFPRSDHMSWVHGL